MISAMTKETLTITCNYLAQNYSKANFNSLLKEIFIIAGIDNFEFTKDDTLYSYENVQKCYLP